MSIRIHQLAEELGIENSTLLSLLKERKIVAQDVRSVSSTVDNIAARALRDEFRAKSKSAKAFDPLGDASQELYSLTPRALQALKQARKETIRLGHPIITPGHILLGLVRLGNGVAAEVLSKSNISIDLIESAIGTQSSVSEGHDPSWSAETEPLIKSARRQADKLLHSYTGTEHILLALTELSDAIIALILSKQGITLKAMADAVLAELNPILDTKERPTFTARGAIATSVLDFLLRFGNSLDEPDKSAFRMAAAFATRRSRSVLNSMDVLAGYLLTSKPGRDQSEQALAKAIWDDYKERNATAELKLVDMSLVIAGAHNLKELAEEDVALLGMLTFSPGLARLLAHSSAVASDARAAPQEFSTRHLIICLLGPVGWKEDPEGAVEISNLGCNWPSVRRSFRDWMKERRRADDIEVIDSELGLVDVSDRKDSAANVPARAVFQRTFSRFVPDKASFGPRADNGSLDDSLGVGIFADHLSQLIAAKETLMPLSIGLFGTWGSGKSHFIDLLDERLRTITARPGAVFHSRIIQIRFNAWHYLDTNLWANLVCEIFDQLFASFEQRNDTTPEQVENLKRKLAEQSALASEAKAALGIAEKARQDAEVQLRNAMRARTQQEISVARLLDDLSALTLDTPIRNQLKHAAISLGLPRLQHSYAELESRAEEVRSLSGRIKGVALAVFTGPDWWHRAVLLSFAALGPLGITWVANHGAESIQQLLSGVARTVAQIVTAFTALSIWFSAQIKIGNNAVNSLETAYTAVKRVRAERENTDDATSAQKLLAAKRQEEEEARHTLREAENKAKCIRAELAELAPGRQLIRFLKERASAEDYRRHLGLVSLVRKDFERLSDLLLQSQNANDPKLPRVDRVVLYIDDLDRCRADRVIEVLEAVHLLLAFPLFAVVVAVDPRWLRQSLLDRYPRLLAGNDAPKGRNLSGYAASPQDYLEKIFQIPFHINSMDSMGYSALAQRVFTVETNSLPTDISLQNANVAKGDITPVPLAEGAQEGSEIESRPLDLPKQSAPPDPKRLSLSVQEFADVSRFQPLFTTPRALKRFANTYALIRVGVQESEWHEYLGSQSNPGIYRIPMFMLAVTSAFPALSSAWLQWLQDTPISKWELGGDDVRALFSRFSDRAVERDWRRLADAIGLVPLGGWPKPTDQGIQTWAPRVGRYSF